MSPFHEPFFLVVVDDATDTFSVEGPIQDDRPWNEAVVAAQNTGRQIHCFSAYDAEKATVAARLTRERGWRYSAEPLISLIEPSPALYRGTLPGYAAGANRARVVSILCRGQCGGNRWAEMSIDYPGPEHLKSKVGQAVHATCLRCGYRATDPYNWTRP